MLMTREKIISTMLCAAMVFSLAAGLSGAASADAVDTPPYPNVEFGYTETVTPGTIRYTSQNPKSDCFYAAYWNNDASLAQHQCLAACLSMDLSYVGVDATPRLHPVPERRRGQTGLRLGRVEIHQHLL